MKQYLLKKWIVIIASLMASSLSFATCKEGEPLPGKDENLHLVLRLRPARAPVPLPVQPRTERREMGRQAVETREMGAQTDAPPAPVVAADAPEKSGRKSLADLGFAGAGALALIAGELLDELSPAAQVVRRNDLACGVDRESGSSGISLSDRFATFQEQNNIKKAILASFDTAEKEDLQRVAEEEEIVKAIQLSREEAETAEAIAIVEAIKDSQEVQGLASAINESRKEAERVNVRKLAKVLFQWLIIRRIASEYARRGIVQRFLDEFASDLSRFRVFYPVATCRQEALAGSRGGGFEFVVKDELFKGPIVPVVPTLSSESSAGVAPLDEEFCAGFRAGFMAAHRRGVNLFGQPTPRLSGKMYGERRDRRAPAAAVVTPVVPAVPKLVTTAGVSEKSREKLVGLRAQIEDLKLLFSGGVCVDLVGDSVRGFVENMLSGVIPTCEQVEAVFAARKTHVESLTAKRAPHKKQVATVLVASNDVMREVVGVVFREIVRVLSEADHKAVALARMQIILTDLKNEKDALQRIFSISSASIMSVE